MAKKKSDKETEPKKVSTKRFSAFLKNETTHFVIGLISVIFAVYLLLAFTSFFFTGAADQSILDNQQPGELMQTANHVKNYAGARGAQLAEFLINECFGLAAYFIILFLAVVGMKLMKAYQFRIWKWFMSCSILLIWFSITLGFIFDGTFGDSFIYPGGLHGHNVSNWLISQIGIPGLGLLLFIAALLFFIYLSNETILVIRKALRPSFRRKKKEDQTISATEENPIKEAPRKEESRKEFSNPGPAIVDFELEQPTKKEEEVEEQVPFPFESKQVTEPAVIEEPAYTNEEEEVENTDEPDFSISEETNEEDEAYKGPVLPPYNPRLDLENYKFPSLDLLNEYEDDGPNIDMEEQNANKDRIIKVLRSFGIEISSIKASVGPTITLYEITPAEGVRISKIRNLEDDIALSLSALQIRIIAPMPGKGTIGIEVPNKNPQTVSMQSVIASRRFVEGKYELPVAMGKTITNEVFMFDLCKTPHLLVAGATGQGKSVGLNAIITSLLYKKHPSELKFVMVDPKMVEFSIYSKIERHYLAKLPNAEKPIVTEPADAVATLNSLVIEMEDRYRLLVNANVRNIKEYNAKFIERRLNPQKGHRFLPYIVAVVDEFADLIAVAGREIELPISRIAAKARAVGIHMILATQRPDTKVITGTIKSNFPSRIAFKVASMIDSRTILDAPGANRLIGRGDMLIVVAGQEPVRVQCAFVDTPEVEDIVDYIGEQAGFQTAYLLPDYVPEGGEASTSGAVDLSDRDPLFDEAARLIVIQQQGSTSLIQRKFAIGYNRAGRLMDQLEAAGIVGPFEGSKARQVLVQDEYSLEQVLNALK